METKNAYDQKVSAEAMPINKDHAIRYFTRGWENDLTPDQWNEVFPRIVAILQEECRLENWLVGEDQLLKTTDVALAALGHEVDMTSKDWNHKHNWSDIDLEGEDLKHVCALEWAVFVIARSDVVERRIKKIVGAGLTCLISKSWSRSSSKHGLGISTLQFPEVAGNQMLKECLKAYRVLDDFCCWDFNGFTWEEDGAWKMAYGRNLLACLYMIDMQVGLWIEKAEEHLETLGLKVEGILLGEDDILSRSDFNEPMASGDDEQVMVGNFISAMRSTFPLAINNDDGVPCDVGFATAGGMRLAQLAPKMFLVAQLAKGGCQWQLIGTEYHAVWLTFGTTFVAPLSMDVGLHVLKAFEKCDPTVFPSRLSKSDKKWIRRFQEYKPEVIRRHGDIQPIDDDEGEVHSKRKADGSPDENRA